MGLLGGGGVHATVGMQVWRTESSRVGFAGRVGGDFSLKHLQKLQASGVDLGGLTTVAERKTPRAWTIFEDERLERRRFLFRTSEDEYRRFFRVSEADVPRLDASLKTARGAHIICGPERLEPLCVALRQHLPRLEAIIFEPSPPAFAPEEASRMAAAAPLAEIFSAGLEESRTMLGDAKMSPEDVCRRFREWGARLVVLRMGAAGSLVFTEKGEFIPVPALPLPAVVDVTGAGNAYCGGFLVAWVRTRDALHAALCGAVSASFTVEAWGVPAVGKRQIVEEAQARLERLRQLQRAPAPAPALLSAAAIGDAAAAAAAGAPAARLSVRIAFISERWVPTAPEVPAGARTSLRVALRVKPGVKTIDVGRLAGKVKLFFGLLQQSRALSPENGFLAYTAQQEAGEGGAPSNYVVSVYFGDPPARIAQRFFNQFLGGRLQVEQMYARFTGGREEKEPPAPPPAAPQQPPSFEGDFSVSLGLSARQLCAVLVALSGGEASRGIELPNAVRELLAFLGRTCEELGEVTLRSEERCLRLTMSGFALSEVVAFVERADGAAWHDELAPLRFLRSGNPPIEQVASELFAQHPALLAFLEFGALFAAAPLAGCAVLLVGMQRAILYHPEPVFAAFPDAFGLPYEDCILACEDGVNLHSWLVRAAVRARARVCACPSSDALALSQRRASARRPPSCTATATRAMCRIACRFLRNSTRRVGDRSTSWPSAIAATGRTRALRRRLRAASSPTRAPPLRTCAHGPSWARRFSCLACRSAAP